jgi:hypothetical protein
MKGAAQDLSAATYQIHDETHTIGNALRWMLMKKCVIFIQFTKRLKLIHTEYQSKGRILWIQVNILLCSRSFSWRTRKSWNSLHQWTERKFHPISVILQFCGAVALLVGMSAIAMPNSWVSWLYKVIISSPVVLFGDHERLRPLARSHSHRVTMVEVQPCFPSATTFSTFTLLCSRHRPLSHFTAPYEYSGDTFLFCDAIIFLVLLKSQFLITRRWSIT